MSDSKPFDLLAEYGKFGLERKISLRDPANIAAFADYAGNSMGRALDNPILMQGQRAEAMFEALLVSLGEHRLIKAEDAGRLHPNDQFRVPDFRVVLSDGTQWLIEVKNVYEKDPLQQTRKLMKKEYREQLEAYAAATGAKLKLAVYWARWSAWTLVSPERLVDADGNLTLDMVTAIKVDELGALGDRLIGTRPPLRLLMATDPARTSPIAADGTVKITIGEVKLFCRDDEITDPTEQQIAWLFMQYGEWKEIGPEAITDGDKLEAIEFRWEPRERANKGFEMIGTLSRMFAGYYAENTIEGHEVKQLRAPSRPGWFAPLVTPEHKNKALPIWCFTKQPNFDQATE